ncbi:MAG: hypothetical protein HDR26_06345 [Lachnospiraceae bacterium]|nr:hypothetical protein [Lachnospiraceae bacterium]
MKKRSGYIFTNKFHSSRAIMSTFLGLISTVSLVTVICLTYIRGGEASLSYGLTGLLAMLMSMVGIVLGVITALEKDRYRLFPALGILFNLIALAMVALIICLGVGLIGF